MLSPYCWLSIAILGLGYAFQFILALLTVSEHEDMDGSRACVVPLSLAACNLYMMHEAYHTLVANKGYGGLDEVNFTC